MIRPLFGFVLCVCVVAVGCGGDGDDTEQSTNASRSSGGGSGPSIETVVASCQELCTAKEAAGCISSAASCISFCQSITPYISGSCRGTKLAAQECELAMGDVCGYDCLDERSDANVCEAEII